MVTVPRLGSGEIVSPPYENASVRSDHKASNAVLDKYPRRVREQSGRGEITRDSDGPSRGTDV
ncbi:MAG: hypothetical protein PHR77_00980 [Kiritimatiellae bacterium]|nr:hypothetical protein [Kiritimatiellia bacterium]MDD5519305.1 hypothetical protein [Kiritimatiellia bacterium]